MTTVSLSLSQVHAGFATFDLIRHFAANFLGFKRFPVKGLLKAGGKEAVTSANNA